MTEAAAATGPLPALPALPAGLAHPHAYADAGVLAQALASGIAAVLAGGIATRGAASLAVSGGTTPVRFLEALSGEAIDWSRVTVTLVDERFVPETSERSNMALVRRHLLKGRAAAARAIPLAGDGPADGSLGGDGPGPADGSIGGAGDLAAAVRAADLAIPPLGSFDAVVLGMGTDGHTASFFPGGDRLDAALDMDSGHHVVAMQAEGAGEPRLTLTLPVLLRAHFLALHIEGEAKLRTLHAALEDGPVEDMPVRAVLRAAADRLHLFWAP